MTKLIPYELASVCFASLRGRSFQKTCYLIDQGQPIILATSEFGRLFDVVPGLSDHTLGITVSIAAVAQGSCLFEKYFTLNRVHKGLDNEFSIELYKLQQLCQNTHDAWQALGHVVYDRHPAEVQSKVFR